MTAPRVDDRRDGHGFTSAILPPCLRRSPKVTEVLPELYLRGLSTNDFAPALEGFFGSAAGLSPSTIQRLTEAWRHLSSDSADGLDGEVARRFQDVLDHVLVVDREVSAHSELLEHLRGSNDSRIGLQQNTDLRKMPRGPRSSRCRRRSPASTA